MTLMKHHPYTTIAMLLLACAAATACSGVGRAQAASAPAMPSVPSTPNACFSSDFSPALLARVNEWRSKGARCGNEGRFGAVPPLAWNGLLARAATRHSRDMAAQNLFSHTGSDGSSLQARVDAAGYAWRSVGENIAAGSASVNAVVDGWIASPPHCANLMSPRFIDVGAACFRGGGQNTYSTYWTLDLAAPQP